MSRKKSKLGPIGQALIKAADDPGFIGDPVESEWVTVFHNNPEDIPSYDCKVAWWMCDLRDPAMLEPADVDHIFLCNREYASEYEDAYGCPVTYLPQPGMDVPMTDPDRPVSDVVFIGNTGDNRFHENRSPIINRIMSEGVAVEVISGQSFTPDTKYIYQNTPISLSISKPVAGYTSNRTYNILAAGGFCLIRHFPGIEDLFENHVDLVWFHGPTDAAQLAKYYLENDVARNNIALAGHENYKRNHTAIKRIETINETLYG